MLEEISEYIQNNYEVYITAKTEMPYAYGDYNVIMIIFVYKKDTNNGEISVEKYNKVAKLLKIKVESKEKMLKQIDRLLRRWKK